MGEAFRWRGFLEGSIDMNICYLTSQPGLCKNFPKNIRITFFFENHRKTEKNFAHPWSLSQWNPILTIYIFPHFQIFIFSAKRSQHAKCGWNVAVWCALAPPTIVITELGDRRDCRGTIIDCTRRLSIMECMQMGYRANMVSETRGETIDINFHLKVFSEFILNGTTNKRKIWNWHAPKSCFGSVPTVMQRRDCVPVMVLITFTPTDSMFCEVLKFL